MTTEVAEFSRSRERTAISWSHSDYEQKKDSLCSKKVNLLVNALMVLGLFISRPIVTEDREPRRIEEKRFGEIM